MCHCGVFIATVILGFQVAGAAIVDNFATELGDTAPARLVFSQKDLARCLTDGNTSRCVLRGQIKIDEETWRTQLAATGGVAVLSPRPVPLTITSGPVAGDRSYLALRQPAALDFNNIPGLLSLTAGTRLRMTNLHLGNLASAATYQYSASQPYQSVGVGMSIWPTINVAPNATFVGVNLTATYINPSGDDCARYMEKSLAYLLQSFGTGNVTTVNATTNLIYGPISVTFPIRVGTNGTPMGEAQSMYKYLATSCIEATSQQQAQAGISPGTLATAIAVPLAAAVALAACGLLTWRFCRRKHDGKAPTKTSSKEKNPPASHHFTCPSTSLSQVGPSSMGQDSSGGLAATHAAVDIGSLQQHPAAVSSLSTSSSTEACVHAPDHTTLIKSQRLLDLQDELPNLQAAADMDDKVLISPNDKSSPPLHLTGSRQQSAGSSYAQASPGINTASQDFGTGDMRSGLGRGRTAGDARVDTTTAVLKARSDAAVLKELKLGPLLGEGCFGKVYSRGQKFEQAMHVAPGHSQARHPIGLCMSGLSALMYALHSHAHLT